MSSSSQETPVIDPFLIPRKLKGLSIQSNPYPTEGSWDPNSSAKSENESNELAVAPDETSSTIGSPNTFKTHILHTLDETFTPKPTDSLENGEPDYLRMILTAKVYDVSIETPLQLAKSLTERYANNMYLKREDMQPVFSFKCRGACNKLRSLNKEELARGVIAVSAGNHAQGLALAARKMGVKAIIVMPKGSPEIKWANVKRLGAEVVFYGNDFDEAKVECIRMAKENNYTFIHPYDDPYVIAGQGTVGVEILKQFPEDKLDAVFVCCGGGGLLAGVAAYIKRIKPEVMVFGVNTQDSDSMTKSLRSGHRVELKETGLFADGTAIRLVGKECFRVASLYVDGMITVTNDEVCAAIKDAFTDARSVPEPSGALAIAGMKKYVTVNRKKGCSYVAIISGANINFPRLRFVVERAKLGENKEALLFVTMADVPGGFIKLYEALQPANLTEICYRKNGTETGHILVGFETSDRIKDVPHIVSKLAGLGIEAFDASENEAAKSHLRFMVGGRTPPGQGKGNERLFRLRFPERPGSFGKFISNLQDQWDFTLLHYRNLGGDVGRIFLGVSIKHDDAARNEELDKFLKATGLPCVEETNNPVCQKLIL